MKKRLLLGLFLALTLSGCGPTENPKSDPSEPTSTITTDDNTVADYISEAKTKLNQMVDAAKEITDDEDLLTLLENFRTQELAYIDTVTDLNEASALSSKIREDERTFCTTKLKVVVLSKIYSDVWKMLNRLYDDSDKDQALQYFDELIAYYVNEVDDIYYTVAGSDEALHDLETFVNELLEAEIGGDPDYPDDPVEQDEELKKYIVSLKNNIIAYAESLFYKYGENMDRDSFFALVNEEYKAFNIVEDFEEADETYDLIIERVESDALDVLKEGLVGAFNNFLDLVRNVIQDERIIVSVIPDSQDYIDTIYSSSSLDGAIEDYESTISYLSDELRELYLDEQAEFLEEHYLMYLDKLSDPEDIRIFTGFYEGKRNELLALTSSLDDLANDVKKIFDDFFFFADLFTKNVDK